MSRPIYKKGERAIKELPVTIKKIDKENYTLTMVASTQDVDRHGDTVIQKGWDLGPYLKNPVILNSHKHNDITEIIAKATRTEIVGKGKKARLEQDWKFAVKENPKAKIAFDLYAEEYASASSVGFIPTKFKENKDGTRDWFTIEEAQLLEVSAVSIPANAAALAKSKGIDVEASGLEIEKDVDDLDEDVDEQEEETDGNEESDEEIEGNEEEEVEADDEEEPVEEESLDEYEADVETDEQQEKAAEVEETKKTESYQVKAYRAIKRLSTRRQKSLVKAHEILTKILNEDSEIKTNDERLKEKVQSRKINQAIRSLMKAK